MSDERAASSVDRRIGVRVRARRLDLGMSQETLADALGITFQQVQKYEKGVNRIAAGRLYDIAAALETPITYFFTDLGGKGSALSDLSLDILGTPEGIKLVALFSEIKTKKLRARVVDLVRALVADDD